MKLVLTGILLVCVMAINAQVLSWSPQFVGDNGNIEITMDANFGNKGLLGQTVSDVYVHTGVITNLSTSASNWRYVAFNQNFNAPNPSLQAQSLGNNRWRFTINNIRTFYGVPNGEVIQKIAILFRSGNGSRVQRNLDGSDMYIPIVIDPSLQQVRITNPFKEPTFTPVTLGLCKNVGDVIPIAAVSNINSSLSLYHNGVLLNSVTGTSIASNLTITQPGLQRIVAEAVGANYGTVLTFNGNGDWANPANWAGGNAPGSTVPMGTEVVINPSPGGSCTLNAGNTLVTFAKGSKLTVANNASFIVIGDLNIPTASDAVRDTVEFFVASPTVIEPLPAGVAPNGVTYSNGNTSATLVLYAANKNNVVVIGDFSDWKADLKYQMKRTPDNLRYWVTIDGLTPGQEYAYQYTIDCNLTVADYNSEKILDPWNDKDIPVETYPNLKPYPTGKTTDIVSLLQPGKPQYNWVNNNFVRPDKRNIICYELLVRDFAKPSNFQTVINSLPELAALGINTLKLMPFTEFENNNSWGYNPSFMFAVDKFYGTENKLRELIDSCHGRGIAVVLDMVLNHQFGQSPMVRMYWDAATNKPANNSPWFNPDARHPFNVGFDMNHEAPATIEFVENVMKHWLTKFRLDGFRWDLSKGFTQRNNPNDVGAWNAFDQSRINIWQRIYNQSQQIAPGAYMILEHLGNDDEEAALANMGMLLWGKMTDQFNEASMGNIGGSNFQRAYHTTRWSSFGGNNTPHLLAYAESHDEERLMNKNRRFGNASQSSVPPFFHNPASIPDGALRMQQVAAFLFTIPGPKMLWQHGEFGYDASINMCENFTTPAGDGCRTSPKPLVTSMPVQFQQATVPSGGFTFQNYKTVTARNTLRDMYARMLRLRTRNPDFIPTFVTNNVSFDLGGNIKWQVIQSNSLRMVVIGNFGLIQQTGSVTFPTTGTWQVYAMNISGNLTNINSNLTATQLQVNAQNQTFTNLPPGTFLVFLDRPASLVTNLQSFEADLAVGSVQLNWQVDDERNIATYEIERSLDEGVNYEVIGAKSVQNLPAQSGSVNHSFADGDKNILYSDKKIYYRIRMVDRNGDDLYSQTQIVKPAGTKMAMVNR
jgi:1,4-alpha-glucan branching enzyme